MMDSFGMILGRLLRYCRRHWVEEKLTQTFDYSLQSFERLSDSSIVGRTIIDAVSCLNLAIEFKNKLSAAVRPIGIILDAIFKVPYCSGKAIPQLT